MATDTVTEVLDWLCLIRSERVGPATFYELLHIYGSASAALEALPTLAARAGRRALKTCSREQAEGELTRIDELGGRFILARDADYPKLLNAIPDPPPVLAVRGRTDLFSRPTVAIVGARNASASGRRFARGLAADLGGRGFVISSGMARGIDSEAHRGALTTGTIAVLGGGVDIIYPPENNELYNELLDAGAVVSEQPMGTMPQARHFPRRNRLVTGLAQGVVVVEASLRSGSLISARLALEQGREVFAVPGSPLDPRHRGTNGLLRQGAILTETVEDVIDGLAPMIESPTAAAGPIDRFLEPAPPTAEQPPDPSQSHRRKVAELLSPTPVSVDEIIRQCQLTPAMVLTILLELDLGGQLERHPGNKVSAKITKC